MSSKKLLHYFQMALTSTSTGHIVKMRRKLSNIIVSFLFGHSNFNPRRLSYIGPNTDMTDCRKLNAICETSHNELCIPLYH